MNKFFKLFFVTFLLLIIPVTSEASCNILIDGEELICHDSNGNIIEPFIENGTTYVPVRAVATAFDTSVSWDQDTKTVFIGTPGGTPVLGDYINIFVDGKEFFCLDANGTVVYPILRDGATYLPIRGIGQLFGKKVLWDNLSKSAVLTTPPSADAIDFLKDSVNNTENLPSLNVLVAVDGSIYMNDELLSSVSKSENEPYSPWSFSLSSFLPDNYADNVSYLGNGKYFLTVPSDKFSASPNIVRILSKCDTSAVYSPLYITISTRGGYVTDAVISFCSDISYNNLIFREIYTVKAIMQYPEGFSFPGVPYPETPRGENETFVPAQDGEDSDSTRILSAVEKFISSSIAASPKELVSLLCSEDNRTLFAAKSKSQYDLELATMKKKLASSYQNATGVYNVSSLVYIDASMFGRAERAAKAVVSVEYSTEDEPITEEVEIIFKKIDGTWYIDSSMIENLIK